jgi:hypothetical protein
VRLHRVVNVSAFFEGSRISLLVTLDSTSNPDCDDDDRELQIWG